MKKLQNQTSFSHLVLVCALKKKGLKLVSKKLVVPNIGSCLHTQLNQNRKYQVTTGRTIVFRYTSSVFVAPNMWKTSAVGQVWVKNWRFMKGASLLVQELRLRMNGQLWLFDLKVVEFFFFTPCPMNRSIPLFCAHQKKDSGWKSRQFSVKIGRS